MDADIVQSLLMLALCGALNLAPAGVLVFRFPLPRRSLNLCALMMGWIAWTSLETLLAGLAGHLTPRSILVVSALMAGAAMGSHSGELRPGLAWVARAWGDVRRGVKASPWLIALWACVAAFIALRQWVHMWFLPPYVYDVLVYHLPRVADWVREGRIFMAETPVLRGWWPANFELLQAWVAIFFHHDALIELPGLLAYLLFTTGVFSLLREAHLSRMQSAWLSLAGALTPAVFMQAVSCKNDLAVAAVFIMLLAVWTNDVLEVEADAARLFWTLIALGWGVGVKPYLMQIAASLLLLLIWNGRQRRRIGVPLLGPILSKGRRGWLMIACAAAGVLGGYWYFRNWACKGNPLYPVAIDIGPWKLPGSSLYQQGAFSWSSLVQTTHALFGQKIWDSKPYGPELGNMAGWGWFILVAGVPLSILAVCRDAGFRRLSIMFACSFILLYSTVNSDPWNMRFAIWLPVLFTIGAGVGLRQMANRDMARAFMCVAVGMCALNAIGSLNNGSYSRLEWRLQINRILKDRKPFTLWDNQLTHLPADAVVAYRLGDNDPLYLLHDSSMRRKPVYLETFHDGSGLKRLMSNAGSQWLFLASPTPEEESAVLCLKQEQWLHEVWGGSPALYGRQRAAGAGTD